MSEPTLAAGLSRIEAALATYRFAAQTLPLGDRTLRMSYPTDDNGNVDLAQLMLDFGPDMPTLKWTKAGLLVARDAEQLRAAGVSVDELHDIAAALEAAAVTDHQPVVLRIWRGVVWVLSIPLALLALILHLRQGGTMRRFPERLGLANHQRHAHRVIWIHAASLGEVTQLARTLQRLQSTPDLQVLVTTLTQAGADWLARSMPDVSHQFCPLDTPGAVRRFLRHWRPNLMVIVENDLWPEMIRQCSDGGIPLMQLNARASRSRGRFPAIVGYLSRRFACITCRSDSFAKDLRTLGVHPSVVTVTADLRATAAPLPVDDTLVNTLRTALDGRAIWVAASTHEADIAPVMAAQKHISGLSDALLIWAPRHAKTTAAIKRAAEAHGLALAQRSSGATIEATTDIYLADTHGELGSFFALSGPVYLGGGLGSEGGHNPFEPAAFGAQMFSGPNVDNFRDAFEALKAQGDVKFVEDGTELAQSVLDHLAQTEGQPGHTPRRAPTTTKADRTLDTVVDLIHHTMRPFDKTDTGRNSGT